MERARQFSPPIQRLIFATSAPRDAAVQRVARKLSKENIARGWFAVDVLGWEDLEDRLTSYPDLLTRYYPQLFGDSVSELTPVLRSILDVVVDTHRPGNQFGLMVHNKGESAKLQANAQFKGQKSSEGPFPLIWGFEANEGDSITLMKGETSFVILGAWEYLPDHKTHRIDLWKHTGRKEPYKYHPAFWNDGSPPDDPVQVDIQILSDPPLVTPFRRSYAIRFDQQGGGVVVE